jgi:hypothetical protein
MKALLQFQPAVEPAAELKPFKFGPITIPVHPKYDKKGGKVYVSFRFKLTIKKKKIEGHASTWEELREIPRLAGRG